MKNNLILFLLICNVIVNAQIINGKIISAEDDSPLSFAKIGIENQNLGVISDKNGNFTIDLTDVEKNNNLIVQFTGFENYTQKIQDFIDSGNHTIALNEKMVELEPVVIAAKKLIDKNWGVKTKSKSVKFGFNPSTSKGDMGLEFGVLIRNKKKANLRQINLNLAEYQLDEPLLVKFNIYSRENGMPGESLLEEELTAEITKDKIIDDTFSFDISDQKIWVRNEDFFVTVQVLDGENAFIYFSGALLNTTYERRFYSPWGKITIGAPAINIDVKVEK